MDCDSVSLNNDPFRVCLDICDRSEISKTRKSANLLKKKIAGNIVGKKDKGNKNNLSRECAIGSIEREREWRRRNLKCKILFSGQIDEMQPRLSI